MGVCLPYIPTMRKTWKIKFFATLEWIASFLFISMYYVIYKVNWMQVLTCIIKLEIKDWESVIEKMRVYSIKNCNFNQINAFFIISLFKIKHCLMQGWINKNNLIILEFFKKFRFQSKKTKQLLINQVKLLLINLICKW